MQTSTLEIAGSLAIFTRSFRKSSAKADQKSFFITQVKDPGEKCSDEPHARFSAFRKLGKRLVGERGFEPPTPWSRTRFSAFLKAVELCSFQVIVFTPVAVYQPKAVGLD
jgi:hypothetical protein